MARRAGRRTRDTRSRAIDRGLIAGGLLVLSASLLPVPYVIMSPGPTFNTIGEYNGQPVIKITGTKTYPTDGSLDMTTVSERGGSSGGVHTSEVLLALLRDNQVVVPRDALYPPDKTGEQVKSENTESFATSQSDAIGAALGELGIPAEESVVVAQVKGGSPASGIVQAGDQIEKVNGEPVESPKDVVTKVQEGKVGEPISLELVRTDDKGKTQQLTVEVVPEANPDPERSGTPYVGIAVAPLYQAPFDIDFTLDSVGGPSAGMTFSLAIIDKLTKQSLTGGGHVAGTGTITPSGKVGPIGGIRHKMVGARNAGAKLFLAPKSNCAEVVGHIPDGLRVVPVATLHEARTHLQTWSKDNNAALPSCP